MEPESEPESPKSPTGRPPSPARIGDLSEKGVAIPPAEGIRSLFIGLVVTMILLNFDGGGIAAVLPDMQRGCVVENREPNLDYDDRYPCLSEAEQGLLGALPYIGLCCGCPIVGRLLQMHSEKTVIWLGIVLDATATMVFAYVIEKHHLFLAKFLVGFSHSGISVYCPVWVDRFGPEDSRTLWIGIVQGTAAIGSMVGYGITGYMTGWGIYYQWSFRLQAFGLAVCAIGLMLVPRTWIDISSLEARCDFAECQGSPANKVQNKQDSFADGRKQSRTSIFDVNFNLLSRRRTSSDTMRDIASLTNSENSRSRALSELQSFVDRVRSGASSGSGTSASDVDSLSDCLRNLWRNRIYRSTTLALCSLFFVVTGVQYWTSKYFIVSFQQPQMKINTVFIILAGSAPLLGVAAGGPIVDRFGGYATPRGAQCTALLSVTWGLVAAAAGIMAACTPPGPEEWRLLSVVSCIWVLLLFGAGMLPPTTGLILSSVDGHLQVFANATSMLLYNLLGFGLGSYLPGQVAAFSGHDERLRLHRAMQVIFFWSIFGLFFMIDSYLGCVARCRSEAMLKEPCVVQLAVRTSSRADPVSPSAAERAQTPVEDC